MIPRMGFDAANLQVSAGHYAVHPAGHVIVIPPTAPLKEGFRWAMEADMNPPKAEASKKPIDHQKIEKAPRE